MSDTPELDDLVKDFLMESYENLDQVDQDFIALEQNPQDTEILDNIFRTIHTIKGSCGFLDFSRLEELAHNGETLLGLLREGALVLNVDMTTALLDMVDRVREALEIIESTGAEGDADYSVLIGQLQALQNAGGAEPVGETPDSVRETEPPQDQEITRVGERTGDFFAESYACLERIDAAFLRLSENPDDPEVCTQLLAECQGLKMGCNYMGLFSLESLLDRSVQVLTHLQAGALVGGGELLESLLDVVDRSAEGIAIVEETGGDEDLDFGEQISAMDQLLSTVDGGSAPSEPAPESDNGVEEIVQEQDSEPEADIEAEESQAPPPETPASVQRATRSIADNKIRVDVDLLDRLMAQMEELVLSRNQILQHMESVEDNTMVNMSQRLDLVTSELQESMMLTRLQTIDTVWNKLPRVVRDLSMGLGKQISMVIEGADTELDKTLIESIRDPMTHLVRNAVDHGIETPEERTAAGKAPEGTLTLRAYHEGGLVNVVIADDGKGIDAERIVEKAIERGLISADRAKALSTTEKFNLIFMPGFSTADQVTNISGRGVGMDVVKSNIEKINGIIEVTSELGKGTQIRLKIPLTLAIMPALMVSCEGNQYAIPQVSLIAVVRLEDEEAQSGIEVLHNAPVHRWRGRLLPLVYLRRELKLPDYVPDKDEEVVVNIAVLQVENRLFGLVVDQVHDSGEIVVKPLGKHLSRLPVYAGATIMGDGKAALILDVLGLAQNAAVVTGTGGVTQTDIDANQVEGFAESQMVLLVQNEGERLAIPVDRIPRLEQFRVSAVERSGEVPVIQYRGSVMPLKKIDRIARPEDFMRNEEVPDEEDLIHVVVHNDGEQALGLVVDQILDIVEERFEIQPSTTERAGFLGTAVIQNRVAEVIDIDHFGVNHG